MLPGGWNLIFLNGAFKDYQLKWDLNQFLYRDHLIIIVIFGLSVTRCDYTHHRIGFRPPYDPSETLIQGCSRTLRQVHHRSSRQTRDGHSVRFPMAWVTVLGPEEVFENGPQNIISKVDTATER